MNKYAIALKLDGICWNETVEAAGGYKWGVTHVTFQDGNGWQCASFAVRTVLSIKLLPKESGDCCCPKRSSD